MINEIVEELYKLKDPKYAEFQAKLVPNIDKGTILGVRIPTLRKYANEIKNSPLALQFLNDLPHKYYDENILHSILLSYESDFSCVLTNVEKFLPFIDNWAVCDILTPKVFAKYRKELLSKIIEWSKSDMPYTIRFGIEMLMKFYLENNFMVEYNDIPLNVKSNDYYVNMMIAWYFATALVKQWESTIIILENKKLSPWIHNKTIQKAIESFRISNDKKEYLRTLKIL